VLNIVCYWWGDWAGFWGPLYVNKLYAALKRNSSVPFNFYCFTDAPQALPAVDTIYFKPDLKWNLNKYVCFYPEYNLKGRVLLIDLDVLITGNINHILDFDEDFITCEGAYQKGRAGGSLVGTNVDRGRELLQKILDKKEKVEKETSGSERFFIRNYVKNCHFWQPNYGGIYSFKVDCKKGLPDDACLVRFHGKPRPHEVLDNYIVRKYWI
jgi:hypothetical protein